MTTTTHTAHIRDDRLYAWLNEHPCTHPLANYSCELCKTCYAAAQDALRAPGA